MAADSPITYLSLHIPYNSAYTSHKTTFLWVCFTQNLFQNMNVNLNTAPSPRHKGVLRISGFTSEPTPNERVDSGSSVNGSTHDQSNSDSRKFSINFCNIRGLSSNFQSVEHHLISSAPNLLFLTETQVSRDISPDPFSVSGYNLIPLFRFKGGVCAYSHSSTPVTRLSHLESPNYDALWLRLALSSGTKFICCIYRSPNSTNYADLFDYLTLQYETILSSNPQAEVIFLGDFNVHHKEWLHSSFTDPQGDMAHTFAVFNNLE